MGIPDTYTSRFFSAKTKHCIIGDMNYATSFPILNGIEHKNYATLVLKYLPVREIIWLSRYTIKCL